MRAFCGLICPGLVSGRRGGGRPGWVLSTEHNRGRANNGNGTRYNKSQPLPPKLASTHSHPPAPDPSVDKLPPPQTHTAYEFLHFLEKNMLAPHKNGSLNNDERRSLSTMTRPLVARRPSLSDSLLPRLEAGATNAPPNNSH